MGTFGHKVRFFRFTDSVCENVIYHIRIANPSIATLNSVYKHWASEAVSFANENKNNQKVKKHGKWSIYRQENEGGQAEIPLAGQRIQEESS